MTDKVFVYVGETFIPGLPQRVSESEADALGVKDRLAAAIKNGQYVEEKAERPAPVKTTKEA